MAVIVVQADPWPAGTWDLALEAEGLSVRCTVDVPAAVGAPTLADVVCNDRVERSASVLDTASFFTLDAIELRAPVAPGVRPAEAQLVVGHTVDGVRTVTLDEARALAWRPTLPRPGTCSTDCAAVSLDVVLP